MGPIFKATLVYCATREKYMLFPCCTRFFSYGGGSKNGFVCPIGGQEYTLQDPLVGKMNLDS